MSDTQKLVNWFEIPVNNIDQATEFYNKVFETQLHPMEMNGLKMGVFPSAPSLTGGAVVQGENYVPSDKGSTIFFNGGNSLSKILERVEPAGGKVIMPETKVNDQVGSIGIFLGPDGNKVALHTAP